MHIHRNGTVRWEIPVREVQAFLIAWGMGSGKCSLCLIRPNTCSTSDVLIKVSGLGTSNLHPCFQILCTKKKKETLIVDEK